jgi:hypothetical protein
MPKYCYDTCVKNVLLRSKSNITLKICSKNSAPIFNNSATSDPDIVESTSASPIGEQLVSDLDLNPRPTARRRRACSVVCDIHV